VDLDLAHRNIREFYRLLKLFFNGIAILTLKNVPDTKAVQKIDHLFNYWSA
jgi:hypothetical protein